MVQNHNYNTIFFDAGGVLFDTKIFRSQRIKNILKSRGFSDDVIEKALLEGDEFSKIYLKTGPWLIAGERKGYTGINTMRKF